MLVLEADHVLRDAASPAIAGGAVAVRDGLIAACGTAAELRVAYPGAETVSLATFTIESSVEPIGIDTEPSTPTPRLAELLTFFSA